MLSMLEAFREHLARTELLPEGTRLLVGYSGGADSTCLVHLLKHTGIDFVAAHLHHGQRPEADKEMALCEAFCQELDVPFASGKADVPRMAADLKIGLEEAGRHARYSFFNQAAFRLNCELIATAHTRTDHIETTLLNLARGAGLSGLAGIALRRENIVRPLLAFSREQTRAYCEEHGLWFHDDPANEDFSFSRARVRHRILTELRAINPGADEAIVRLAEIADEEDRFLNGMAAAALEQSEIPLNGPLAFLTDDCEAAFERATLSSLPPVLFRRAVRLASTALGAPLNREQTLLIEQGVASLEKGSITAEGGEVVVEWNYEHIVVRQVQPTEPFRYALTVPGETVSDEFGWQFTAFETAPDDISQRRATLEVLVPKEAVKGTIYFRSASPGDSMRPLGFDGSRKLSDIMSEAKLTLAARARLPIVCDMVGPIWAPGVCLDNRMKLTEQQGTAILLRFGQVPQDPSHNMETGVRS